MPADSPALTIVLNDSLGFASHLYLQPRGATIGAPTASGKLDTTAGVQLDRYVQPQERTTSLVIALQIRSEWRRGVHIRNTM